MQALPLTHVCSCLQYYDDTAGILRSVVLSAVAPHRLSMAPQPIQAFSLLTQSQSQGGLSATGLSSMQEPLYEYDDEMEDR